MPGLFKKCAVAVAVGIAAMTIAAGNASATTTDPTRSAGIFVVQYGDESFTDSILRMADRDPTYRKDVLRLLPIWLQRARTTPLDLDGPTANDGRKQVKELTNLRSVLTAPGRRGPGSAAQQQSAAVGPQFVDPGAPNSWSVRGSVGSGRTYWKDLVVAVAGRYCTSSCIVTDQISTRFTVNPGAVTDMISATTVYSPNSGNFNEFIDLLFKSINKGTVTGTGRAAMHSNKSGTWYQGNGKKLNGTVLTVATAIDVEIYPSPWNGSDGWDGGKTADAVCNKSDNLCRYP